MAGGRQMKRKQLRMGALALTMMMGGFFPSAAGSCAELSLDEAIEMALAQNTALKVTKK